MNLSDGLALQKVAQKVALNKGRVPNLKPMDDAIKQILAGAQLRAILLSNAGHNLQHHEGVVISESAVELTTQEIQALVRAITQCAGDDDPESLESITVKELEALLQNRGFN